MRISVCMGNYTTNPYRVPGLELTVYCAEELCYCFKENAFLLDNAVMDDTLLKWLDRDCGLTELVRVLYPLVHKKGSLSTFVCLILEYVGLYPEETLKEVEQVLKRGAGLSAIEKRKKQVDYLVQKKKYAAALEEYRELLKVWDQMTKEQAMLPAATVKADILHNRGVAFTGLMIYEDAADCFQKAYEISHQKEYFAAYLAAKRMELPQEDYIAFAAGLPEHYQETLQLEKKLNSMKEEWMEQPEAMRLSQRKELRNGAKKQLYYEENEQLVQTLKEDYRSSVKG